MPWFITNTYGDDVAVLKEYRHPNWLYTNITLINHVLGPLVMVAMWALAVTAFGLIYPASGVYLL